MSLSEFCFIIIAACQIIELFRSSSVTVQNVSNRQDTTDADRWTDEPTIKEKRNGGPDKWMEEVLKKGKTNGK